MVQAARAAQSRSGTLRLGFFPGLTCGPLRAALSNFTRASPDVRLHMVEDFPGDLYRQLNERAVDLIVVGLMPKLASKDIETEALWEERLILALPSTHPMAGMDAFRWIDVAALPLIIRSSHDEMMGYRAMLRLVSDYQIDCEQHPVSRDALLDLVGMGMGATSSWNREWYRTTMSRFARSPRKAQRR